MWKHTACLCLSGLFSSAEEHHHFFGQADVVALIGDFVSFYPLGHGEFFVIDSESIIAVYVAKESEKKGTTERPWLAFIVAEILDLQSHFLHNFSVDCFLNGFADLCKACDQGVAFESAAFVFGQDDLIAVGNSYDNCRTQNRVFVISAGGTFHHTLFLAVDHRFAAAAAELALIVPLVKLMACNSCECQVLGVCSAQHTDILKSIIRKQGSVQMGDQIETLVVNGKQVDIITVEIFCFAF